MVALEPILQTFLPSKPDHKALHFIDQKMNCLPPKLLFVQKKQSLPAYNFKFPAHAHCIFACATNFSIMTFMWMHASCLADHSTNF